jgi:hypothetical protein
MNLRYPRNELDHGCNPSPGGVWPDFATVSKRAVAQASGMSIDFAQPRAWRRFDGL